jgi:predicted nucleic acid-binding protein
MRVCLDETAYVHFRRGTSTVVDAIRAASGVVVPAVVVGELQSAFRRGRRRERNEAELARFLAHPAVSTCDMDLETAEHYARIADDNRRQGVQATVTRLWVAASAAKNGLTVLTCDEEFRKIRGVAVEVVRLP